MTAIPPIDKSGELKKAGILLDRWRKQLQEAFPGSREWPVFGRTWKLFVVAKRGEAHCDCYASHDWRREPAAVLQWVDTRDIQRGIEPVGGLCRECFEHGYGDEFSLDEMRAASGT